MAVIVRAIYSALFRLADTGTSRIVLQEQVIKTNQTVRTIGARTRGKTIRTRPVCAEAMY
jgi:hypothetical protein